MLPSPAGGTGWPGARRAGGEGKLRQRAKAMRARLTEAEQRLWLHLRAHRFLGLKFKRQVPIGHYIADFVCHESHLIVEIDGGQHADQTTYDKQRDQWLGQQGFTILRFWNNEVLQQTEAVLEQIRLATLSPNPSPACGRGGTTP